MMEAHPMRLKWFALSALLLLGVSGLAAREASAHKLAIESGFYSLSTTNVDTNEPISQIGAGVYQIQYSIEAIPHLSAEVGYFLIIGSGLSGLDSNGLEAGASYFPFTNAEARVFRSEDGYLKTLDLFRPYIGAFFVQRQVSSASFAGYGAKLGTEWVFRAPWLLKADGRFVSYSNADSAPVIEMTANIGIGLEF